MDVRAMLAQSNLFVALSAPALDQLAARTSVRDVASGETLLEIGSPAESLYIVAVGRLRVVLGDGTVINDIGRFEPTGEISLISGEPRTATVYAVRDTKVLKVDREALYEVFVRHPSALLEMSRTVIARLRQNQRAASLAAARRSRCFALLPASPGVDLAWFANALAAALSPCGEVEILDAAAVDAALGAGVSNTPIGDGEREENLIDWLQDREIAHRHLVYVASAQGGNWSRRCIRQADRVLVMADAGETPKPSPMIDELRKSGVRAAIDLVLVRPDRAPPGRVLEWRETAGAPTHYFLRPGMARDVARIARSLTGRAVGLVLGGGGARGFAHIGLMRAIEEAGIEIDVIGGASMGAFVAALAACGHDSGEMLRIARHTFVGRNLLNDYLFPSVSMIRGRKFLAGLKEIFGDQQIEDLRTPFYCVSTNLSRGKAQVHDRGPLSVWLGTSMCIPGVAPPVVYKGELLVDGAVINSLPTDIMQSLERGPIIASDVSTEGGINAPGIEGPDPEGLLRWSQADKRPGLFTILFRTATLTSESGVSARAQKADLYLRMPVNGVAVFDWKKIDEVVERGYRCAMERLPDFKANVLGLRLP
ncbi:MAG: patatin-like phospholipase family protein [Panacagrimonas sp.]